MLEVREDACAGASGELVGEDGNGSAAIEDDEMARNQRGGSERSGGERVRGKGLREADGSVGCGEQDADESGESAEHCGSLGRGCG